MMVALISVSFGRVYLIAILTNNTHDVLPSRSWTSIYRGVLPLEVRKHTHKCSPVHPPRHHERFCLSFDYCEPITFSKLTAPLVFGYRKGTSVSDWHININLCTKNTTYRLCRSKSLYLWLLGPFKRRENPILVCFLENTTYIRLWGGGFY